MTKLVLMSAGKSAVLSGAIAADLYIDCRVIWNPFRDPVLGGLTGDHAAVQHWLREKNGEFISSVKQIINLGLATRATRNSGKNSDSFTVCFFCLAGVHRSRGMKNVIGQDFKGDFEVEIQ